MLRYICMIHGGFGRINRDGLFEVVYASGQEVAEEIEYRTTDYEEYMVKNVTCVVVQTDTEDSGVTAGEDVSNPYLITANPLLYGKSAEELKEVGSNILEKIKGIQYRPNTTQLSGLPYMEVGDAYSVSKNTDTFHSYIFSRTLTGIQGLIDTYTAKGDECRKNEVSVGDEIIQ